MNRIPGFRGEYLWELDIAEHQLLALAEAFSEDLYGWKPSATSRSVSELLMHLATGNFMVMDVLGMPVPTDLYPNVSSTGMERFAALVKHNDEMDKTVRDKETVRALLARSLNAVRIAITKATDADLEQEVIFFREQTTVRRGYLRALVHMHEHMGQLIAYTRMTGSPAPWPDWRPDRR